MAFIDSLIQEYMGLGFTKPLLLVGSVMYVAWTAAYLCIIIRCFKDRSYGIPFATLCFNVTWEFLFSFQLAGQNLAPFFRIGNFLWFAFDVVILYQFLKYGREAQVIPFLKKHLYPITFVTLVIMGFGLYTFTLYYGDISGAASSMTDNLFMSILFIFMLFGRYDNLRGLSYPAAWLKMIGTVVASFFLYFWMPAQFIDGVLHDWNGAIHQPVIHQPHTFSHMHFLFVSIFFVDCVYIYLLTKRRQALSRLAEIENNP